MKTPLIALLLLCCPFVQAQPKVQSTPKASMISTNLDGSRARILRFDGITNRIVRVQSSADLSAWREESDHAVDRNGKMYVMPERGPVTFYRWADLGAYVKPSIVRQPPTAITVEAGQTIAMSALGDGSRVVYQWMRWDGGAINVFPTGTNDAFTLPAASVDDSGNYYVSIRNAWDEVVSRACQVTVKAPVARIAPASLAGKTFVVGITAGMPPFMTSGTYKFTAASTGNSYIIVPLTFIGSSSGTYSYSVTGPDQAAMTIQDSLLNAVTATVKFLTPTAGTIEMKKVGSSAYQRGNFVLD